MNQVNVVQLLYLKVHVGECVHYYRSDFETMPWQVDAEMFLGTV